MGLAPFDQELLEDDAAFPEQGDAEAAYALAQRLTVPEELGRHIVGRADEEEEERRDDSEGGTAGESQEGEDKNDQDHGSEGEQDIDDLRGEAGAEPGDLEMQRNAFGRDDLGNAPAIEPAEVLRQS